MTEKCSQRGLNKFEIRNTNFHSQKAHFSHFLDGFMLRLKSSFPLDKPAAKRDIFGMSIYGGLGQ